jgi:two-component system response regulator GlrR
MRVRMGRGIINGVTRHDARLVPTMDATRPEPRAQRRSSLTVDRFRLRSASPASPEDAIDFVSSSPRIVIGRHERCDLVLARDPSASSFHCEIAIEQGVATIRDLGSLNGTLLQGVPVLHARLLPGVTIGLGATQLRFELAPESIEPPAATRDRFGGLVGASPAMQAVYRLLERAAASTVTVLLTGETGTGKDLAAQAIHDEGDRRDGPFIVVDCGAIPANLLESELFGHERGAFTGAVSARAGCFEAANHGTIFLDEIGELAADLQPKLLRVLESRQVRRLGSHRNVPIDVRVIAATNRDLRREVNAGRFRSDLYYRLAVLLLHLPPLRERIDDVPAIVERILQASGQADRPQAALVRDPAFVASATGHSWPGNVRELRNFVERTLAVEGDVALGEGLSPAASNDRTEPEIELTMPLARARELAIRRFETRYLEAMLAKHGDVATAARAAGVDRTHFYRLVRKYRE